MAPRDGLSRFLPVSDTEAMSKDPDYIDPKVLKRRAAAGETANAKPGRPVLRRPSPAAAGTNVASRSSWKFEKVSVSKTIGVKVAGGQSAKIS